MIQRSSTSRLARASSTLLLLAGGAAAFAAMPPQGAPSGKTPAAPIAARNTRAQDTVTRDSVVQSTVIRDTVSPQGAPTLADSAQPSMTQREAPPASGAWPVDAATGLTLVNGTPVVGRVFVMTKTDGLRAYEGVSRHYVGEPLPPEPPAIGTRYRQPDPSAVRRHRGMMVQSNLWSIETKPSAIEMHHHRPVSVPTVAPTGASPR